MMAKRSRVLVLLAALALGAMYALPVWTIDLEAPQYPEGLGMVIRINTIEGKKQHDLDNINNLNHYIGMQRIVPESIPELDAMPIVVGVLMALGVLVALTGWRRALYGWVSLLVVTSLLGMADFWKWEYDYGHNLDEENAIIKIPGMSYQPPLIGSRQILNFTAHSWPGAGGAFAILAAVTAVAVAGTEWRRGHRPATGAPGEAEGAAGGEPEGTGDGGFDGSSAGAGGRATAGSVVALAVAALLSAGCADPSPRPLRAGSDACADCLMVLDAGGHGAELVSRTGKVYTFDSVECMVSRLRRGDLEPHSSWVTDFANPGRLVPAEEAFYLASPTLGSPMGLGITAFARAEDRDGAVHAFGGAALDWPGVRERVAALWPEGSPRAHGGHAETLDVATRARVAEHATGGG